MSCGTPCLLACSLSTKLLPTIVLVTLTSYQYEVICFHFLLFFIDN